MPRSKEAKCRASKNYYDKNRKQVLTAQQKYNSTKGVYKKLERLYGLEENQYQTMFEEQRGCCAICGTHQLKLKRRLSVDHDHVTGKVRGLLCQHCNTMLGYAKDNWQILEKGINYLIRTTN